MKIVISACLAGYACRYDGKANTVEALQKLHQNGLALAVCPECLGGLPVPRTPCEIQGNSVVSAKGTDCTENFRRGALLALHYARLYGASFAVIKAKSPSCGLGRIYDGSFSRTLIAGNGIFARMLLDNNFIVCTEKDNFSEAYRNYYALLYGKNI